MTISEAVLERMIQTTPRSMRVELFESIRALEVALSLSGFGHVTWVDALERYRRFKRSGAPAGVAVLGLLPRIVLDFAKDVDHAFRRIHEFKPEDYATVNMVEHVNGRRQSESGKKSGVSRRAKAESTAAAIEEVTKEVMSKVTRLEKREMSWLRDRVVMEWQRRFPEKPPSRNTLTPVIKRVLAERKTTKK